MKTNITTLFAIAAMLLGLCACDKTENEAKEFFVNFAQVVSSGNSDEIARYYLDATDADSLAFAFNPDSLRIETLDNGTISVTLAPGVDAILTRDDDGTLRITQSHGLFAYNADRLDFAKKTGQYNPKLTDTENALRMGDRRFMNHISETVYKTVKDNMKTECDMKFNDDMSTHGATTTLTVTNNNDFDLPGECYEAYAKMMACLFDDDMNFGMVKRETLTGKMIPAHGSVRYLLGEHDFEYEGWEPDGLTIMHLPSAIISRLYTPTGGEYDAFIAEHGAPQAVKGDLALDVRGLMDKCGTHLTLNGKSGTLVYNPSSTSLEPADNAETRTVSVVSYDRESGKLVLQVNKGTTTTGTLDGVYIDGTFEGKFKNLNGNTSKFSFK